MKKRLLAAIMSLCMIVSLLPVSALAVEDVDTAPAVEEMVPLEPADTEAETPQDKEPEYGERIAYKATITLKVGESDDIDFSGGSNHDWAINSSSVAIIEKHSGWFSDDGIKVTGRSAGEAIITHTYTTGIIFTENHTEYYRVIVNNPEEPVSSDREIYFFLTKPDNSTFESAEAEDFYYLLHGGSATTEADKFKANNGPEINTQNEDAIIQYVESWPSPMKLDLTEGASASDPVDSGSTWTVGLNGKVTAFTFELDGNTYSSDPSISDDGARYAFRWAKIGWVGADGTSSGNKFHMDGMLYKVVQAQDVVTGDLNGVLKDLTEDTLSFDTNGVENTTEVFSFTLASCDENGTVTPGGVSIPLTATVTSENKGGSVVVNIKDEEEKTVELVPGYYIITENLAGDQDNAWETPAAVRFQVNTNGTVKFQDEDKTVDNTLETYTLSYNAGDGTGAPTNSTHKYNEKTSVSADKPTQKGYEFQGWDSNDDDIVNYRPSDSIQIKGNVELVAVWEKVLTENLSIEKTVKLLDGETPVDLPAGGVKVNDTLQYNVTVTNNGTAVRDVVVTDIMFPNDGTGVRVTSNKETTPSVNWNVGSATITSELAKDESVTFTYTYPVTEQDQNDNSIFNEASVWLNNQKKGFDNVTVSVSTETYTLTYDANGGYFGEDQTVTTKEETNDINVRTLNRTPEYTPKHAPSQDSEAVKVLFLGWTTENNNAKIYSKGDALPDLVENNETVTVSADGTSIYAVWGYDADNSGTADVLERTVTFDTQGGTLVPSQTVKVGLTVTKPTDPTKDGFTFAGWYLNDAPYDFGTPVTEDITLVAHWNVATRYTVTYDANNGTLIGNTIETVIPGQEVQLESSATRDGYIFMGWTTTDISGLTYGVGASLPDMETSVTPTGDMTVYAVWSQDTDGDKVPDVNEVFIAPADITIYTGGTGYEGVSDGDGNEIENSNSGLPEPGFHIILPADLGLEDGNDLNGIVKFQYNGEDKITGTEVNRKWTLSCVGVYSETPLRYVYSLVSADGTPAVRVT